LTRLCTRLAFFYALFSGVAVFFLQVAKADTVVVSGNAQLAQTLATVKAGDVIRLTATEDYVIQIRSLNFAPELTITSDDATQPARIASLSIDESSGIRIESVAVDPRRIKLGKFMQAVRVIRSKNIGFYNNTSIGSAKQYFSASLKEGSAGEDFAFVRWSDGIVLEGNRIDGFMHGIAILESTNLRISKNLFTGMQGDGIRMGGVQNLEISDNRMQDFFGSDQSVNHSDMIQLWSTNAKIISSDIVIERNWLLSGNGPAYQSIFFRNEQADQNPGSRDRFYKNITIKDNVVHNGHLHGITVGETMGLIISNNTLIPNPISTMGNGSDRKMYSPGILVAKPSINVAVTKNVTSAISGPESLKIGSNYVLAKDSALLAGEYRKLFGRDSFSGALPDSAFRAKTGGPLDRNKIGSSLMFQ
jgi:hypothetical protein